MSLPIFYSFRRCPYAMRARLALASSGVNVELREVVLRDKPTPFLNASPSATVPCLKLPDQIIDESFDIMTWALERNDPEGWLDMPNIGYDLVQENDEPFKTALDRYKYSVRHKDVEIDVERENAGQFLAKLNRFLGDQNWLFSDSPSLADMAILPFVRQFAHVDPEWFSAQPWPEVAGWLERFKASERFGSIMVKYAQWHEGDEAVNFP